MGMPDRHIAEFIIALGIVFTIIGMYRVIESRSQYWRPRPAWSFIGLGLFLLLLGGAFLVALTP